MVVRRPRLVAVCTAHGRLTARDDPQPYVARFSPGLLDRPAEVEIVDSAHRRIDKDLV